ncbi:MAG TPA: hypothetical protein VKA49_08880 [Flavitalea sp.]|nr:hypothetical protein [Flavitalea sp.]
MSILLITLSNCGSSKAVSSQSPETGLKKFLLRDEGLSQLSYVDRAHPISNWHVAIPAGRDIQLVGSDRVMIGTGMGYEEREIATGRKVHELTSFDGTIAARRLRNGNTLLVGLNWQGRQGIVLVEVDNSAATKRLIVYPGFAYVRLVRETVAGTFLVTADDTIFEGSAEGSILWRAKIVGHDKPHVWQALRLSNGQIISSSGFAANFQFFGKDGKLVDTISGPASVRPHFYAGFQILSNDNLVVTNWQGHGPKFGGSGVQLLEYNRAGKLVWSWKQDSTKFSSLQGVIVLDGLDPKFLHVEDGDGKLAPIK